MNIQDIYNTQVVQKVKKDIHIHMSYVFMMDEYLSGNCICWMCPCGICTLMECIIMCMGDYGLHAYLIYVNMMDCMIMCCECI